MPSPLSDFPYRDGVMQCEGVSLAALAESVGTPFYCYSAATMARQYHAFARAFAGQEARICYAVKANSNQAVLRLFARLGAGADVVSEGELRRALAAGIPAEHIVFSGVAKTEAELGYALSIGIGQINIESAGELDVLARLTAGRDRPVRVALRVNPDVDAKTHPKITTGKAENKFGVALHEAPSLFARAAAMPGIEPVSVAVHIGSQLLDLAPYDAAFTKVAALVRQLREAGIPIRHLDLGGGVGVPYRGELPPDLADYAGIVRRICGNLGCSLTFEPGRFLVAEAGALVSRVIVVKQGVTRRLVIQDAAMNDLLRPTLYEAYHPVLPVRKADRAEEAIADIVGPVCETGDYLAVARPMPPVATGDLLAVMFAGAYGAVMSSTYNTRRLIPEVLVDGTRWAVVRPRQSYEELIGLDRVPDWLDEGAAG
ncbi:MAG TPA: diaminopimelate decarboxylase [Aliidongia sp.]|nr:diaminopimelate decarboxylase [Aliidongia sp.]